MSRRVDELIESAGRALAWVCGEDMPGVRFHEPGPAINIRAVRRKLGLVQTALRSRYVEAKQDKTCGSRRFAVPRLSKIECEA